ncbi:hypothetical protein AYK26_06460 [Euryarchaeota archaeon SM23-78]|nr:MAG: hypothetical protein AYK26_06460 [Euryarchaeota archaeon SM23-78]MBW3001069.1 hypothetical protein [Candidatus Woesearchaeota archaeon]
MSPNSNKNILLKRAGMLILLITTILALTYLTGSVSFTSNPSITPTSPDTTHALECIWQASGDTTQQNITWYKNGVPIKNETNPPTNSSILSSTYTNRGDKWNCTVILSNGTNTTTKTINVTIKNAKPSTPIMRNFSNGQDIGNLTNVTEDDANVFNLTSSDPDGDKITYGYYDTLPSGSSFSSATGIFNWTPDYDNNDVNITFYAKDNQTPFANTNKFVMFIVQYVNDAPYFSPGLTDQSIDEGEVFNYYIYGADEESNTPYNFTLISAVPSLNLTISILSNTSAVIMFGANRTATYLEAGNYTVTVAITDNLGANTTDNFNLQINQINAEPVLELITNKTSTQGQNLSFFVYANDPDVNNTLNFSIIAEGCPISNPWSISTINNSHNATGLVNVSNLTNNHVICRNVNITVIDDLGARDSQDVFLNISNTNDPPNIGVLSSYLSNTDGNNITNLTGYALSSFIYKVNATDIDNLTYEGEFLIFRGNSTFFNISNETGIISFTPNQTDVGNHTILINVSDDGGLWTTQIMNLEIINNSAPVLMSIGNLSCAEDTLCLIVINATDGDNDNLTFASNNTAVFPLTDNTSQNPVKSAYISYTPNQSQVGNHSIIINVTDPKGASDSKTIRFTINNTNDAPVISVTFPSRVVETHTVTFYVNATDEDYSLPNSYEYVNFTDINLTGKDLFNITTIFDNDTNRTYGLINFTPGTGDDGFYSINISAIDYYNAIDYEVWNFTVYNKTTPPNITRIRPYGSPYTNQTVFSFSSIGNYTGELTTINFSENRSVLYNISVTDDLTSKDNLSYAWYINGSLNSTNPYLNINYNFFSSGKYNITVIVTDDTYETSQFTWNVSVKDINRGPILVNSLQNFTGNRAVNGQRTVTDYLKKDPNTKFMDPDDDQDNDRVWDGSETSNLNYNVSSCSVATITITGHEVSVQASSVGNCTVYFTATDAGGLSNTSNAVYINVTHVSNITEEVEVEVETGGGGGFSTRTRAVPIPIDIEEDNPKAIEIVVPELVTVYENKTVLIPVTLKNTWNSTLEGVRVNASTNASYVNIRFTEDYFEEIPMGEKRNITMMVENYRLGENYEIKIIANVTEPHASDSALVMLNSIEQTEEGEDVETKVTFAQDLLNENPECMELNELLEKAKVEVEEGSREVASKMVDSVINGCKYLVSISKKAEQKPQTVISRFLKEENIKYFLVFLGGLVVIILLVLIIKKSKVKSVKEEAPSKEEEVKPYWP